MQPTWRRRFQASTGVLGRMSIRCSTSYSLKHWRRFRPLPEWNRLRKLDCLRRPPLLRRASNPSLKPVTPARRKALFPLLTRARYKGSQSSKREDSAMSGSSQPCPFLGRAQDGPAASTMVDSSAGGVSIHFIRHRGHLTVAEQQQHLRRLLANVSSDHQQRAVTRNSASEASGTLIGDLQTGLVARGVCQRGQFHHRHTSNVHQWWTLGTQRPYATSGLPSRAVGKIKFAKQTHPLTIVDQFILVAPGKRRAWQPVLRPPSGFLKYGLERVLSFQMVAVGQSWRIMFIRAS